MDNIKANVRSLTDKILDNASGTSAKKSILPDVVHLMVVSKLVPNKKSIQLNFPQHAHGLSVCLIVKDMDKNDHNKTSDAWKSRWSSDAASIKSPKVSMPSFLPLRELKIAYQPFAAKRRLAATFDVFLADKRIVHHLPAKLGKAFYGGPRGKIPVPVQLTNCNVIEVVEKKMNSSIFQVRGVGTTDSIPIGDRNLSLPELKDNILHVCSKISTEWPGGGLSNVRSIYIQLKKNTIPIFYDASEAIIDVPPMRIQPIIGLETTNVEGARKHLTKHVSLDLLSRVAQDLPLPKGGLEEVFNKRRVPKSPKRIGKGHQQKAKKVKA